MKLGIRQIGSWSGISFLNNPTRPSTLHATPHLDWWSKIHVREDARLVADVVLVPSVALVHTKCLASFGLICNRKVLKGDLGLRRIQTDANGGLVRKPGYCTARSLHLRKIQSKFVFWTSLIEWPWFGEVWCKRRNQRCQCDEVHIQWHRCLGWPEDSPPDEKSRVCLFSSFQLTILEQTSWLTAIFT